VDECRIHIHLDDETATSHLARTLAASQPGPAMVHLGGDLGAGKSTLARAWLRALGVTGTVPSPTYTLVERYQVPSGEVLHLDLYRVADAGELEFLGLDELTPWLWLVEWPERAGAQLPPVDLSIHLALAGNGRSARIAAKSLPGRKWLGQIRMPDEPILCKA